MPAAPSMRGTGEGEAAITLCAPGGKPLIEALSAKLGIEADLSGMEDKGRNTPSSSRTLHRLHALHQGMLDGCDHGREQADAHDHCRCLPRLFQVRQGLPTDAIIMVQYPVTLANWHWQKPEVENTPPKPEVVPAH